MASLHGTCIARWLKYGMRWQLAAGLHFGAHNQMLACMCLAIVNHTSYVCVMPNVRAVPLLESVIGHADLKPARG